MVPHADAVRDTLNDMTTLTTMTIIAAVSAAALTAKAMQPGLPRDIAARIDPASVKAIVVKLESFGTRHTLSDTTSATRGIGAARRWVHDEFMKLKPIAGDRLDVFYDTFEQPPGPRIPRPVEIVNVVAVLKGTMPEASERRYLVMGHLDSRVLDPLNAESDSPGANDDASGVALALAIARALADKPLDATLVFIATSGEEQGLLGARNLAKRAQEENLRIHGVLNNDMVGDPTGPDGQVIRDRAGNFIIRVFSEGLPPRPDERQATRIRSLASESDGESRQLARFIADVARRETSESQPMLVFRPDRFLRGGDHTPFNEIGVPAVRFTVPYEHYDRQHVDVSEKDGKPYGDLATFVDAEYLAAVTRLNAAVLVHLANAPRTPSNARVITAQLSNDTTIRWDPCPEPDVAGYEVVWRLTTDNDWTHGKDVGLVTEATIDLSKDDWFFGVRAYDREGYRSPVSFCSAAAR